MIGKPTNKEQARRLFDAASQAERRKILDAMRAARQRRKILTQAGINVFFGEN